VIVEVTAVRMIDVTDKACCNRRKRKCKEGGDLDIDYCCGLIAGCRNESKMAAHYCYDTVKGHSRHSP